MLLHRFVLIERANDEKERERASSTLMMSMTANRFLQLILPTLVVVTAHGYHSAMEMFVFYISYIYYRFCLRQWIQANNEIAEFNLGINPYMFSIIGS